MLRCKKCFCRRCSNWWTPDNVMSHVTSLWLTANILSVEQWRGDCGLPHIDSVFFFYGLMEPTSSTCCLFPSTTQLTVTQQTVSQGLFSVFLSSDFCHSLIYSAPLGAELCCCLYDCLMLDGDERRFVQSEWVFFSTLRCVCMFTPAAGSGCETLCPDVSVSWCLSVPIQSSGEPDCSQLSLIGKTNVNNTAATGSTSSTGSTGLAFILVPLVPLVLLVQLQVHFLCVWCQSWFCWWTSLIPF